VDGMDDRGRQEVRVLVFAASLREDSTNSVLARIAATALELQGATIDYATMRDFDCPSYDQDVEDTEGIPAGAAEMRRRLEAADGFVLASPSTTRRCPTC
jgi:chromate reductase